MTLVETKFKFKIRITLNIDNMNLSKNIIFYLNKFYWIEFITNKKVSVVMRNLYTVFFQFGLFKAKFGRIKEALLLLQWGYYAENSIKWLGKNEINHKFSRSF